jgi:hypothetical protein
MRTKKRPAVAAPDLSAAWSAFFEEVAVCDPIELKKEGWMTNAEISAKSKLNGEAGRQLADKGVRRGVLEKKAAKILVNGRRANVNFYRPVDTKCQQPANRNAKP